MIHLLFILYLLIGVLISYILIMENRHVKKVKQLKKDVKWQKTKYKTWKGYMNKGYRIANSYSGATIHPFYWKTKGFGG